MMHRFEFEQVRVHNPRSLHGIEMFRNKQNTEYKLINNKTLYIIKRYYTSVTDTLKKKP